MLSPYVRACMQVYLQKSFISSVTVNPFLLLNLTTTSTDTTTAMVTATMTTSRATTAPEIRPLLFSEPLLPKEDEDENKGRKSDH